MDQKLLECARNFETSGEFASALRIYDSVYRNTPDDQDAILGIAQIAYMCDDLPRAFEFFVRLLIINHNNSWGYLGRAQILLRMERPDKAMADIRQSIKYDTPPSSIRIDIAALLNEYNYPEDAFEVLSPVRDLFIQDEDFQAEWLFALIGKNDLLNPDVPFIFTQHHLPTDLDNITHCINPASPSQSLENQYIISLNTSGTDPYFIMCHMAFAKKQGLNLSPSLIDHLLTMAPELEDRITTLGL